ncbi:galactosylceramide sulfotransferase-like [Brachionus plicatilis]|uniref:Galactosylceramide sulfotransferase-like n=1 Tax=Brachionus plicatilis TaxID=10195 RepID=A0A3M7RJ61_BRAPC|nr:galactosylceramide sulfotransferase-like [Brachionus plicatilis]
MNVIQKIRSNFSKGVYSAKNKISFSHAIHNSKLARKIFPKNNSIYVTIIRDPVKQFLSSLNYDPPRTKIKELYFKSFYNKTFTNQTINFDLSEACFTRNLMSYDLGLVECDGYYEGSKKQLLKDFQQDFDLVLLAEYFNEGMVLLKKFLNLSYDDIVCLSVNEGTASPTQEQRLMAQEIIPKEKIGAIVKRRSWNSQKFKQEISKSMHIWANKKKFFPKSSLQSLQISKKFAAKNEKTLLDVNRNKY